jgi:hypothetical protein
VDAELRTPERSTSVSATYRLVTQRRTDATTVVGPGTSPKPGLSRGSRAMTPQPFPLRRSRQIGLPVGTSTATLSSS